jgi:hypothetical protein
VAAQLVDVRGAVEVAVLRESITPPASSRCRARKALKGVGSAGLMIAVGARGAVYRYDADGEPDGTSNRWTREDAGTQRSLAGIFTEAGVWVPTIDGVLMRRNGADDWDDESVRTPAPVFLQDVWVDSADVVTVGDRGAVWA